MSFQEKKLIKIIIPKEKHWVGDGFHVSSIFSIHSEDYKNISPFLLLDHASPKYFPSTKIKLGVGEHPHRGFETVTFAISGEVDHRDSAGGGGTIKTGGVQWMTAGKGVVHDEFHSRKFAQEGGEFEMIQLWVNLPSNFKMTNPRYQSFDETDFPIIYKNKGNLIIKIIAGSLEGTFSPVKTFTKINIFEINSKEDFKFKIPFSKGSNTLFFQILGESHFNHSQIQKGNLGIFSKNGSELNFNIAKDSKALILNGEPIVEPIVAYGPFVMNTKDEILEAFKDFQEGKMSNLVD